jgi:hypothetical protein
MQASRLAAPPGGNARGSSRAYAPHQTDESIDVNADRARRANGKAHPESTDVITTPMGDIRTTRQSQGTSNGTEAGEWDRATKVPENGPGTEPTASDKILVVEPDILTDRDQALVTTDAKQSQMTGSNESD